MQLQGSEGFQSMEVGVRAGQSGPAQVPTLAPLAVNGRGIDVGRTLGQKRQRNGRAALPSDPLNSRLIFDGQASTHGIPSTRELEDEVVSMRAQLDLGVPLSGAENEELDDLVIPQEVRRTGTGRRRRISVVGSPDQNRQLRR